MSLLIALVRFKRDVLAGRPYFLGMSTVKETDDYEKQFVERYLKAQANKRIKELEAKLEQATDGLKRLEIKRKIKVVEEALADELRRMCAEEKGGAVDVGAKTKEIGDFIEDDVFSYRDVRIPMNVWSYLFDYQMTGVKWMIDLFKLGKGGVLADEMGLGKTIQVSATMISLYNTGMASSFLILCPTTIIDQWVKQLSQLQPCPTIHRTMSMKKDGVFVLSYEAFRISRLLPVFDMAVLDEGHKIKNKESQISQAVGRIQAKSRFVITGTPIQNNLAELWSIFNFANPSLLGSYTTFQEEFEKRIKHGKTENECQVSYNYSIMLRSIIEPFILRRMKSSVENILPNKIDRVVFVRLSDAQVEMYLEALKSKQFEALLMGKKMSKTYFLGAVMYLKKICNHPLLIANRTMESSSDSELQDLSDVKIDSVVSASSKLEITFEMIDKWYSENNRALLFFQTYKMLQIAKMAIAKLRPHFRMLEMSGKTATSKRSNLIEKFNADREIFLFLLTTRVGGIGLNLTGANRVIIYDPDWNPSTDSQAKERIYRYGQESDVEIYRLISRDTIEERIYQKQIYKDRLSRKILSNPNMRFDQECYLDMFDFQVSLKASSDVADDHKHKVEADELVAVREEDKRDFSIFKELNARGVLSGTELIDYIKRRECNLSE